MGRSLVVDTDDMGIQRPTLEVGENDLEAKDNDVEEVPSQHDTNDIDNKGESRHVDIQSKEEDSIYHTQPPTIILAFPPCKPRSWTSPLQAKQGKETMLPHLRLKNMKNWLRNKK